MGRIDTAFARAAADDRAALVVYLCAGDPSLDATAALVRAIADAGADVIELGVPFSDPTADGPAIQKASERALAGGATLRGVLDVVRDVRRTHDVPVLLFGYYNPILAYGETALVADAHAAGVDGFLVVDLPPEEADTLVHEAHARGLDVVPLLAPTSDEARLRLAASVATSFVYYVSVTGVTGAAIPDLAAVAQEAGAVGRSVGRRIALGFGIKTPEDVAKVSPHVDGVVVGSATVATIEAATDTQDAVARVGEFVRALRAATRKRPG